MTAREQKTLWTVKTTRDGGKDIPVRSEHQTPVTHQRTARNTARRIDRIGGRR